MPQDSLTSTKLASIPTSEALHGCIQAHCFGVAQIQSGGHWKCKNLVVYATNFGSDWIRQMVLTQWSPKIIAFIR